MNTPKRIEPLEVTTLEDGFIVKPNIYGVITKLNELITTHNSRLEEVSSCSCGYEKARGKRCKFCIRSNDCRDEKHSTCAWSDCACSCHTKPAEEKKHLELGNRTVGEYEQHEYDTLTSYKPAEERKAKVERFEELKNHAHCKCMNLDGLCSNKHFATCDICKPAEEKTTNVGQNSNSLVVDTPTPSEERENEEWEKEAFEKFKDFGKLSVETGENTYKVFLPVQFVKHPEEIVEHIRQTLLSHDQALKEKIEGMKRKHGVQYSDMSPVDQEVSGAIFNAALSDVLKLLE